MTDRYDVWVWSDGAWQPYTVKPFADNLSALRWAQAYLPGADFTIWNRSLGVGPQAWPRGAREVWDRQVGGLRLTSGGDAGSDASVK